jgi:hypothetical protein
VQPYQHAILRRICAYVRHWQVALESAHALAFLLWFLWSQVRRLLGQARQALLQQQALSQQGQRGAVD